jgi:pimeloyl-ACP methyl ester carboxylesterase
MLNVDLSKRSVDMSKVTSKDGTVIAFDQTGTGPAVVVVGGVLGDRSQQAPLAAILAQHFTVFNFDRRGRGESGDTVPYAVEREIEDIQAIIDAAGGSAFVYGTSGCGILSLWAAEHGLNIKKLAIWEPPFIIEGSRPPAPKDYKEQLTKLLSEGRRGDMVALFMTKAVGMPEDMVAQMRNAPWWSFQEVFAHTLVYDADIVGDYSLPTKRLASIKVPTLVIDGGESPWLSQSAQAVAAALPNAQRRTIKGQPHNVAPEAIAPVLEEFFKA